QESLRTGDDQLVLSFFRSRRLKDEEGARLQALIERLGSDSFAARSAASDALRTSWPSSAGALRRALSHPDPEVVSRSRELLRGLVQAGDVTVLKWAVRYLGQARPAEAVDVLLGYLPDAEDASVAEEIRTALITLTPREVSPDPTLVRALQDTAPDRRAAAAVTLCRAGREEHFPAIRRLLRDPDAGVRYQTATALLALQEKQALPILIGLLPELPTRETWTVLDLLYRVAGRGGPATAPGADAEGRLRCRDAWRAWWEREGDKVDLSRSNSPLSATAPAGKTTLLVLQQSRPAAGFVVKSGPETHLRKDLFRGELTAPLWADWLAGDRLLIVDHAPGVVIEADSAGETVRTIHKPLAVFAQRLANGHTFIACRDALWEVDGEEKTVAMVPWPTRGIATARRCLDG